MFIIKLKENKEQPILSGHPWIFAGAIDKVDSFSDNYLCRVIDSTGRFVCQGFYNPYSQISVRVLSLGKEAVDQKMFSSRIDKAIKLRRKIINEGTDFFRLVNSEGDRLPGLAADVYGKVIVLQFLCLGMDKFRNDIINIMENRFPEHVIHERSDAKSRKAESLDSQSGPIRGDLPEGDIKVEEDGAKYFVDARTGDRTGFYIEYRPVRKLLRDISKDKAVLDLFSYTGAFSVSAALGGASSVTSVDSSIPAHSMLTRNMELNAISNFTWKHFREDVSLFLSRGQEKYDLIVCDPPPYAKIEEYSRTYSLAMARLNPGGMMLVLASYASKFSITDMMKSLARATLTSGVTTRITGKLIQGPDYPYLPSHPEGEHVQGMVLSIE
jgi:23S rRNA (cytosine1962-C5)-methyltransferase